MEMDTSPARGTEVTFPRLSYDRRRKVPRVCLTDSPVSLCMVLRVTSLSTKLLSSRCDDQETKPIQFQRVEQRAASIDE